MEHPVFLEAVNRKNEKAWERLYRYYYAPLCSYAEKILGGECAPEDVVQECLIRMWHACLEFSELKALTAWLYKSGYNASISVLREKKVQKRLHENLSYEPYCDEERAQAPALREEVISRFYDILYQMPKQQQDILMYRLKGLKVQEVAELMHISENSVKTHKKRAYLFVREHFDASMLQVLFACFFRK